MKIIDFKEYKILKDTHQSLLEQYILIIEKHEDIMFKKKNYLEALYFLKFKDLSRERLALQIDIKKIKKEIDIINYYLNEYEDIDIDEMDNDIKIEILMLDEEIARFEDKLNTINQTIDAIDIEEDKLLEIKEIFRLLSRILHPDLNQNQNENTKKLWNRTIRAYDLNNIETLKLLLNISKIYSRYEVLSIKDLKKDIVNLESKIKEIETFLNDIKREFPFTIENKINNNEWIEKEKENILKEIKDLKEANIYYLKKLNTLKNVYF